MEKCIKSCIGLDSSEMQGFGIEQDSRETQNSLSSKRKTFLVFLFGMFQYCFTFLTAKIY